MRLDPRPRHGVAASLAAVVVLLAALATRPALREPPHEPVRLTATALARNTPASTAASVPGAAAGAPPVQEPAPPRADTGAASPRVLVESALESQDLLRRTEAYRLLRHCAFVLSPASVAPLVAPAAWMKPDSVRLAEQAWQALAGRCQSLRGLRDLDALQRRLDPVPLVVARASSPTPVEAEWLVSTFRQHGGTAVLWAGDALAAYVEQRTSQPDGDVFEPLEPEAVQIARCRFGEDCSPGSDAAHAACLAIGTCEGDVAQRVLATLGSRAARERVLRQADALTDALVRGDLRQYAIDR
ncbi:hypothetical protein [Ramlibacter pinisoli]|uniref:Uncharacterized protein n=2 Tax=Ramlibacter TaxID=174951 RepID=A0A6N8J432_9BURK|nr:hypothetical protein [Ramlibacter pinisoli]MVQ32986.1 hypothetical protein [Ramlibacter pinisoli]